MACIRRMVYLLLAAYSLVCFGGSSLQNKSLNLPFVFVQRGPSQAALDKVELFFIRASAYFMTKFIQCLDHLLSESDWIWRMLISYP